MIYLMKYLLEEFEEEDDERKKSMKKLHLERQSHGVPLMELHQLGSYLRALSQMGLSCFSLSLWFQ
ncbi:hypothetical protein CIPAW_04G171900 [Carya illinoinensis]|uniref:Uncharacterized protein n=1 Tax=Carya illinoinensis TaxID=32201 RepID=A0A8T1QU72_CARIL|nr:hypothetical protein CIPAW_04G171900 [Carya illinoinensis]